MTFVLCRGRHPFFGLDCHHHCLPSLSFPADKIGPHCYSSSSNPHLACFGSFVLHHKRTRLIAIIRSSIKLEKSQPSVLFPQTIYHSESSHGLLWISHQIFNQFRLSTASYTNDHAHSTAPCSIDFKGGIQHQEDASDFVGLCGPLHPKCILNHMGYGPSFICPFRAPKIYRAPSRALPLCCALSLALLFYVPRHGPLFFQYLLFCPLPFH